MAGLLSEQDILKAAPIVPNETDDPDFRMMLAVNDQARVIVYHTKEFRKKLSWLEFDLTKSKLDFVMNDGDVRNFGMLVNPELSRYMQNAYQVLMVLINDQNEPEGGNYYPLIIHSA